MKTKTHLAFYGTVAVISLTLFGLSAPAQQMGPSGTLIGHLQRDKQLIGKPVISSDNQQVGKIDNLVVDLESGRLLYAVVGTSKGKVAVAPGAFGRITSNNIQAQATKQKIDNAPQFTSTIDQPGEIAKADFVNKVYQYFGLSPWWQGSAPPSAGSFHNVHKTSDLDGMAVRSSENQPLGKIDSVVLDLAPGRVTYVILAPDASLNLGNNLYALPPQAVTLSPDQKTLGANLNRDKLAAAPHFDKSHWPNLAERTFAAQVYQYYGKQPYFQTGGALAPTGRTGAP